MTYAYVCHVICKYYEVIMLSISIYQLLEERENIIVNLILIFLTEFSTDRYNGGKISESF